MIEKMKQLGSPHAITLKYNLKTTATASATTTTATTQNPMTGHAAS